jgi:hypothetical protein
LILFIEAAIKNNKDLCADPFRYPPDSR